MRAATVSLVCAASLACGTPRNRANDCADGECDLEVQSFCVADADCASGEVCVGGACQPGTHEGPCTSHADCTVGMFCHIVSGRCVDCLNDDHCDVGLRCRSDNTCGVGSSIDCPPHAHAEGDLCVCDSGYEQEGDTCVPVTEPDPEPDPDPTPSPAPSAWICDPDLYDSGGWFSECDCGCGAYDPDCYGHALGNCERKHCPAGERVVVDDNALCEPLPEVPVGWTCDPAWYLDGACDCGCGADDGDCPDGYTAAACVYDACPGWQGATQDDPTICWDWQCDYDLYDEGWFTELCHCGCGVWDDEDCSFERSADVCDVNMCPEGQVPAAENNAYCVDAPQ